MGRCHTTLINVHRHTWFTAFAGIMPSAHDLEAPQIGPHIKKYLAAAEGTEPLDRIKVLRLIENLVTGAGAVAYLIESMHGAGPPWPSGS